MTHCQAQLAKLENPALLSTSSRAYGCLFVLVLLLYGMFVEVALEQLDCVDIGGRSMLYIDADEPCHGSTGYVTLVFIGLALPIIALTWYVSKVREHRNDYDIAVYRQLSGPYTIDQQGTPPDWWWFEAALLTERLLLRFVLIVFKVPVTGHLLATMVVVLALCVHIYRGSLFGPFRDKLTGGLHLVCIVSLLVVGLTSIARSNSRPSSQDVADTPDYDDTLGWLAVVAVCLPSLVVVFGALRAIRACCGNGRGPQAQYEHLPRVDGGDDVGDVGAPGPGGLGDGRGPPQPGPVGANHEVVRGPGGLGDGPGARRPSRRRPPVGNRRAVPQVRIPPSTQEVVRGAGRGRGRGRGRGEASEVAPPSGRSYGSFVRENSVNSLNGAGDV